jgi:hypothetical protein
MKLAYDDEQKNRSTRQALLTPPLFANLAKRLEGKPIPEYLDKLVIREHQVPQVIANRIAGYFLDGARDSGMINTGSGALVAGTLTEVSGSGGIGMDGASPISGLNTIDRTGASDRKDGPHSTTRPSPILTDLL